MQAAAAFKMRGFHPGGLKRSKESSAERLQSPELLKDIRFKTTAGCSGWILPTQKWLPEIARL